MNKLNYVGDRSEKTKNYGKCNNRVSSLIGRSNSDHIHSINNIDFYERQASSKADRTYNGWLEVKISVLRKF